MLLARNAAAFSSPASSTPRTQHGVFHQLAALSNSTADLDDFFGDLDRVHAAARAELGPQDFDDFTSQFRAIRSSSTMKCYNCNAYGHARVDCPSSEPDTCYNCGKVGHFVAQAPRCSFPLRPPPSTSRAQGYMQRIE
jgi:hypothetical protein